jgi:hypothetical protein
MQHLVYAPTCSAPEWHWGDGELSASWLRCNTLRGRKWRFGLTLGRTAVAGHFFGELMVEECLMVPGTLAVCIREVQKSLMQSSKRLIETKIQQLGVGSSFKILHDRIVTPGDGLVIFQGMQDATAESIKSLEGFRIAWLRRSASDLCHCSALPFAPRDRNCGPIGIPDARATPLMIS